MPARFVAIQTSLGYDPAPDSSSHVPFHMVPRYGARGLLLLDAPKHTIELFPSSVGPAGTGKFVEVSPGSNPMKREVWVSGFTEGTLLLAAKNPSTGTYDARIECYVAERKRIRVGFYIVHDAAGRKSKIYTASKAKELLTGAEDILYYQANVVLEMAFAKEPFPANNPPSLGDVPLVEYTRPILEKLITARKEADFHVFFLWAMEDVALGTHGMTPLGVTLAGTCMIKDTNKAETVLAHEIVHGFGIGQHDENDKSNLMYKVAAGGTRLTKYQIKRFNQFAPAAT